MNKSDITRNYYMLKGPLAQSEPVIVWNDGGRKAGKRSSLGFLGGRERAAPPFSSWSQVSIPMDVPLNLKGGDCTCTETHMSGHVRVTPEEAAAHPEWMSGAGELAWDLDIQKLVAYHVGYGASKFFRTLNAFEMFWHAEGMKTAFSGWVRLNGEEYIVRPEDCFGYADKNWGGDFTSPWVWLSSNDLVSNVNGQRLTDSVFEVGGGNPKAFGIALGRKLLGQFYYERRDYEYNSSKFWTARNATSACGTAATSPVPSGYTRRKAAGGF